MLISELQYNIRGQKRPRSKQKCIVKCDTCEQEFERRYDVLEKSRKAFNGVDVCRSCSTRLLIKTGKVKTFTEYNKNQKGKTFEERLGVEKAKKVKEKMSKVNTGKNNPNYNNKSNGAKGFVKHAQNMKGKTYEEIYGIEKSIMIKQKISNSTCGEKSNRFGKPAPKGSGNGWSGHYKDIYFRSLLELHYLIYLIDNNIKFESGEKRKHVITYEMDGLKRNYFTDYYLIEEDKYIEIKPKNLINSYQNKLKFEAAKNKLGNKHIVLTEDEIVKTDTQALYDMYVNKEIIFDNRYVEKFENYYKKYRKKV